MSRLPYDVAEGVPVCGFTGINGAGKTLLAAQSAIADMARGRVVYSTVPITSRYGDTRPIRSLRQLLEMEDCTVLLDEVAVIFSSRSSQSLPPEVVALLQTLRHRGKTGVTVRWTAPAWMRCDNLLREVTQGLVNVVPLFRRREAGNPWPTPRLIAAGLLDTASGKTDAAPDKVLRRRFFIPSRLPAFGSYDTHADTPLLGMHLQSGRCVDCGGSVERPKHSPERHAALGIPFYADDVLVRPRFTDRAHDGGSDDQPENDEAGGDAGSHQGDRNEQSAGQRIHSSIFSRKAPRALTPERGTLDTVPETPVTPA